MTAFALMPLILAAAGEERQVANRPPVSAASLQLKADQEALAWLPSAATNRLGDAPVPVLVPKDKLILSVAQLAVETNFYALSSSNEGATISMQGTAVTHRYAEAPKLQTSRKVRGMPALLTDNEGIKSVTWIENGASYAVDVACAQVGDKRCASDEYLFSLVNRLTYVGGALKTPAR